MSTLHDRARAAGLHVDWDDADGVPHQVSDESLTAILAALGATDYDHADDSGFVTADAGRPIRLPRGCGTAGLAELLREDGSRRSIDLTQAGEALELAAIAEPGYHRLILDDREIRLAVAPSRCFSVADAVGDRRIWGASVQIAALRDRSARAFGDFGTLASAARAFAARGADVLAISPVHALFPADSSRFSPYAPSTRLFLNVLYADPALAGGAAIAATGGDLIDWQHAIPERLRALRAAYDARADSVRAEVAAYALRGGEDLERHARFDALHAHFFALSGARGWQDWPSAYHDPASPAVDRFAAEHADETGFYLFLQWLAARSLHAAQRAATDAGMAIGLIADLAVGMDAGGSHAWSRPGDLLTGLSIGAPPDPLGPDGQSWGITAFAPDALRRTGFAPYIATLRAAIGHAGGIRIDHALGLRRLWVVPEGASPTEGAYLTMPMTDMLRLLALESHRAQAIVIGEDLGTVPEGFRPAMDAAGMLGMRVLWFERDAAGGFLPPAGYARDAAAMTGTHDLATVAGWWRGRDIDWTWRLGRSSPFPDEAADRIARAADRTRLWRAVTAAGVADGPEPPAEAEAPAVDAALAFIGTTPSALAIVPLEDVIGAVEQPNLPGTVFEHPNWCRRMPDDTDALLARPEVTARVAALDATRRG